MTSRPHWMRIDVDILDNPKIRAAITLGGDAALTLYIRGLGYAVHYLTDGWIPDTMPKAWSHKPRHVDALGTAGLWHPVPLPTDKGWLINGYQDHQISKDEWQAMVDRAKARAAKRWGQ